MDGYKINMELTSKYEPIEGECIVCGKIRNLFMYENEDSSLFVMGCSQCNKYGEKKTTPFKAALSWLKNCSFNAGQPNF